MLSCRIPTAVEINVFDSLDERIAFDSLDERIAVEHFLGKNLADAEALFREDSTTYTGDLLAMGPWAFFYYVQAAINYLRSDASVGDREVARYFAATLDCRLIGAGPIVSIKADLRSTVEFILIHFDKFGFDKDTDEYCNVEHQYRLLLSRLA
ncbi:MAG: hypothetical protein HYX68_17265 [Planctomycetes bacterium]|jgi:hypothetical protein|nr:hypothetical protein [Planctomycetota bacterium]